MRKFGSFLAILGCVCLSAADYELERVADWQNTPAISQLGRQLIVKGKTEMVSRNACPLVQGRRFEVEVKARALQNGLSKIKVGMRFLTASGTKISDMWIAQGQLPTGAFANYEAKVWNFPAGATQFKLVIQLDPMPAAGAVELKDIEIDLED